jgi:hypothetical protein
MFLALKIKMKRANLDKTVEKRRTILLGGYFYSVYS